jgi:hypothetical protein
VLTEQNYAELSDDDVDMDEDDEFDDDFEGLITEHLEPSHPVIVTPMMRTSRGRSADLPPSSSTP